MSLQAALHQRNQTLEKGVCDALQGNGDVDTWLSKTRSIAAQTATYGDGVNSDINGLGHDPPEIQQSDLAALSTTLHDLHEGTLSSMEQVALRTRPTEIEIGPACQVAFQVGARALEYSGRVSVDVASLRHDLQPPDDAALKELSEGADRGETLAVNLGLKGSGTAEYWNERCSAMAALASAYAALVASHCNAGLVEAIRPQLERLMSYTPTAVSPDSGDPDEIGVAEAGSTAVAIIRTFEETAVELRAAIAAQKTQTEQQKTASASDPVSEEVRQEKNRLELSKTLYQARVNLWDESLQKRSGEESRLQGQVIDITKRVQPLTDEEAKLSKCIHRYFGLTMAGLVSIAGATFWAASSSFLAPVLPVLDIAGAGLIVGGLAGVARTEQAKNHVAGECEGLLTELLNVYPSWQATLRLKDLAYKRRDEAEQKLRSVEGQLEVYRMADTRPVEGSSSNASVKVDENTVRIGDVDIPRRHDSKPG